MKQLSTVLILGNHRNALTTARLLHARHRVVLGNAGGVGQVEQSRFVAQTLSLPDASQSEFPDAVQTVIDDHPAPLILFPIGDAELAGLLAVSAVQKGEVRTVMASPETVALTLDKAAVLDLASRLDVPQANFRIVKRLSELPDAVRDIGVPCVIKSAHQMSLAFDQKAYRVTDLAQIAGLIDLDSEPEHGLIVQAAADGIRHNVYFAADNGRLVGAMEARVTRTNIFDGSGFTVESESMPLDENLKGHTERLIDELGFHGIGNTQFLVAGDYEELSFLEISPRMGAAFALTVPCGFNFAEAGVSLALGNKPSEEHLPQDYPAGIRFAWSVGDFVGLLNAARSRQITGVQAIKWLGHFLRSAVIADIHATWTVKDPKPTLAIVMSVAARFWRYLWRARNRGS